MTVCRYVVGDVFEVLATMPARSVDLVLTSPPFLALRSYLPAGHPAKAKEIGSEASPAAFVDTLLDVVEALERVLAPHGSIVIELGDTYAGSGGAGGDRLGARADQDDQPPYYRREGQPKFRQGTPRWDGRPGIRTTTSDPVSYPSRARVGWPLDKSLALVPESFRWALAYGRNPFNGRTTDPWRVPECRPLASAQPARRRARR